VVVQFGLRAGPVKREIPSTSLRAGSSLRLKSGYAQDDARREKCTLLFKLAHYLISAAWT
jgi:hypothetical protein